MADTKNIYIQNENLEFIYTIGPRNIFSTFQIHSYTEIYFFFGGEVEMINSHMKKKLFPNQLIIIPAGVYHNFHVLSDIENYTRCVINIHPDFMDKSVLEEATDGKEILTLSPSDRIVSHFHYLTECITKVDEKDFKEILAATATDIIYLIKYANQPQKQLSSNIHPLSKELIQYIDANFTHDITLESISERFSYSVSHISHIFKEQFGIGIKNYILQKRLSNARYQILCGAKAQEVSALNGFSNYTSFFRLYKKAFGYSPSKSKKILT